MIVMIVDTTIALVPEVVDELHLQIEGEAAGAVEDQETTMTMKEGSVVVVAVAMMMIEIEAIKEAVAEVMMMIETVTTVAVEVVVVEITMMWPPLVIRIVQVRRKKWRKKMCARRACEPCAVNLQTGPR